MYRENGGRDQGTQRMLTENGTLVHWSQLVLAGPRWSRLVLAGPGISRMVLAVAVERPGLFLCLLHGVIITVFFSLPVVCQDRISIIPRVALELETPLLPLPSG